jgi:hypothetical protein
LKLSINWKKHSNSSPLSCQGALCEFLITRSEWRQIKVERRRFAPGRIKNLVLVRGPAARVKIKRNFSLP